MAVLIVGQTFETRDIVHHSRLVQISETHRAYDTLQYPRISAVESISIPQRNPKGKAPLTKKTVSVADFYSYRLMERDGEELYFLLFCKLLNQFLVDK